MSSNIRKRKKFAGEETLVNVAWLIKPGFVTPCSVVTSEKDKSSLSGQGHDRAVAGSAPSSQQLPWGPPDSLNPQESCPELRIRELLQQHFGCCFVPVYLPGRVLCCGHHLHVCPRCSFSRLLQPPPQGPEPQEQRARVAAAWGRW